MNARQKLMNCLEKYVFQVVKKTAYKKEKQIF